MADIKTRSVNKGDVKTIDRAANLTSRLRSAEVRTKDQVAGPAGKDGENESQYANDNMVQMGKDIAYGTARGVRDGVSRAGHGLKSSRENMDIKTKADMIRKSRGVTDGTGLSHKTSDKVGKSRIVSAANTGKAAKAGKASKEAGRAGRQSAYAAEAGKKLQRARKLDKARRSQFAAKKTVERTAKGARMTAKLVVRSLKAIVSATKTLVSAIAAGGTVCIVIILICTLFASAIYLFGQDQSDEFTAEALGTGDTLIVRVATAQIGNRGGKKFWSWYGYDSRVDWCAIFVSWCADQCGYIKSGTIPKFAGVPYGVDWFKGKGQFQKRTYIPAPGDIIFIDWGGDGTRDHVGIVERCDGKTVYTVEGNSGDACKRQSYTVGSPLIFGYGVPKYPEKEKETTKPAVVK